MASETTHQFSMFGFMPAKVRIMDRKDKERFGQLLREAKVKLHKGDGKGAAEDIREFREFLESFERRLNGEIKQRVKRTGRLMPGDAVTVEMGDKSKTEFVDALVIAVSAKGISVRTYWGLDIDNMDPHLVRRRRC